jgi:hypothetical protein
VPRKEHNPAVTITIEEQIESTHETFEAGSSIAHCHVRMEDQTPTCKVLEIGPPSRMRWSWVLDGRQGEGETIVELFSSRSKAALT